MLSIPTVTQTTGARPVLIFRHPGATLVSYRRMGWKPDLEEVDEIVKNVLADDRSHHPALQPLPPGPLEEARAMGWFWNALHLLALHDLTGVTAGVIVSHEQLTESDDAARRLFDTMGLSWTESSAQVMRAEGSGPHEGKKLHNFDRNPRAAATAWRHKLSDRELAEIEACTVVARTALGQLAVA